MLKVILLAVISLCGPFAYADAETNLTDFAALTLRGSRAFSQDQLALKVYDSLEATPSDSQRTNGFISCKSRGQGVLALVECRIDTHDRDHRKLTVATIEIIGEPFVGFEVVAQKPDFFAGLTPDESGWIQCEKDRSVCRFRVK